MKHERIIVVMNEFMETSYQWRKEDVLEYMRSCYVALGLCTPGKAGLRVQQILEIEDRHKRSIEDAMRKRVCVPHDVRGAYYGFS